MSAAAEIENRTLINDGPGALPLLASLVEPHGSPRKAVMLDVGMGIIQLEVCITFLAQASSNGNELYFEGYILHVKRGNIHGRYSTRTRRGWFGRGRRFSVAAGLREDTED